jgi:hypothetical protein
MGGDIRDSPNEQPTQITQQDPQEPRGGPVSLSVNPLHSPKGFHSTEDNLQNDRHQKVTKERKKLGKPESMQGKVL